MPSFKPIHTKYHKLPGTNLVLNVKAEKASPDVYKYFDIHHFNEFVSAIGHIPRYVIYDDLVEMLADPEGAMQKSLVTMMEAEICHLPFERILVEYDQEAEIINRGELIKTKVRHFVYLFEDEQLAVHHKYHDRFGCVAFSYVEKYNMICVSPIAATASLIANKEMIKTGLPIYGDTGCGTILTASLAPYMNKKKMPNKLADAIIEKTFEYSMMPITRALCSVVVLLQTRGIEKETITINPRMNKTRIDQGKSAIQDHTVIRIGHVYNRKGEAVQYKKGSGQPMPVHWRAGHLRNQRFGKGLERSYELWIKPMLINYVDGPVPIPKIKEVTK